jgi:hypothetical protein
MTNIVASATSASDGGSDVRVNAGLESVDFDTRVVIIGYLPLGRKLMFCQDFIIRTLLYTCGDRLA